MISFLKSLFTPKFHRTDGLVVQLAFTCGGVDYFEVDNIYGLPYKRGVQAIRVYEEMRMKCDYDYLKAHTDAINNIFTSPETKKIGFEEITKIKKLNDQLRERLFQIVDTDIIYKLASVIFFDKNESPLTYDDHYARKKITLWKKHMGVNDFFLLLPLQRLIPFLKQPGVNFQTYSEAIMAINQVHWESLFELLTSEQRKGYSETKDFYLGATRQESVN